MKANVLRSKFIFAFFVILLLVLTGCATATPTVSDPPVESPAPQQPQPPPFQAALTANALNVQVLTEDEAEKVLQRFETVNIPPGGHITLDEDGRGILRFGDRHEVELLGGAEIILEDVILESGGSIFVRLKQLKGHTMILLSDQSVARVALETGDATITTLLDGTRFAVCYNPDAKVNCIHVYKGAVEITGEGQKEVYREGEATFFLSGQPPQPPFCVPQEAFDAWLIEKRSPADTIPLSQLVQDSPPGPCGTPTPDITGDEGSTPTPTRTATATASPTITPTPTRAITHAPPPSPTPTKERREEEEEETEEPPTEPVPTDEMPTEPVPTDETPTEPPPTDETPTEPPPTDIAPTDPPPTPAG